MFTGKGEVVQKSTLLINDEFFCRLLSKESAMSNPSFRAAAEIAVPFVWESQPGTPKYTFSQDTLPPLTPPPSYYFGTCKTHEKKKRTSSRSNLFHVLFPKLNLKKTLLPSSPSSLSSSSSSSSESSKVVPVRRRFLGYDSVSLDLWGGNDEDHDADSPTSTLCFGILRRASSNGGFGSSRKRQA